MFRQQNEPLSDTTIGQPGRRPAGLNACDHQAGGAETVNYFRSFKPSDRLAEELITKIPGDRRRRRRYPLRLEVTFRIVTRGYICQTGTGTTRDVSSVGIAFATETPLNPGSSIELSLAWPMHLPNGCPLQLLIFGKVTRAADGVTAVRVQRYEFRTRAQSNVRTMASGSPMA